MATGNCTQRLAGHTGIVFCVIQLTDGRIVSGSGDKSLRVCGKFVAVVHYNKVELVKSCVNRRIYIY